MGQALFAGDGLSLGCGARRALEPRQGFGRDALRRAYRSEEHTSELQSLKLYPYRHTLSLHVALPIWLDIPLMNCLETNFYAVYEQPAQTAAFPSNDLPLSYGGAGLRPEGVGAWDKPYSPVMVYRWDAVRDALWNLAKVSGGTPFDGHMMRYAKPRSEAHTSDLQTLMSISADVF